MERIIRNDIVEILAGDEVAPPGFRVLIAVRSGELIGVLAYYATDDPRYWYISALGVHKEYRRKKIATALKVQALRNCAAEGARRVTSEVNVRNRAMKAVNEALGVSSGRLDDDPEHELTSAVIFPAQDFDEGSEWWLSAVS